jgi:hypothetical protein
VTAKHVTKTLPDWVKHILEFALWSSIKKKKKKRL